MEGTETKLWMGTGSSDPPSGKSLHWSGGGGGKTPYGEGKASPGPAKTQNWPGWGQQACSTMV